MLWYEPKRIPRMAAKMGGAMPAAAAAGGAAASAASEKRLELGLGNLHRIEVKSVYDIYIYKYDLLSIYHLYMHIHMRAYFLVVLTPKD